MSRPALFAAVTAPTSVAVARTDVPGILDAPLYTVAIDGSPYAVTGQSIVVVVGSIVSVIAVVVAIIRVRQGK